MTTVTSRPTIVARALVRAPQFLMSKPGRRSFLKQTGSGLLGAVLSQAQDSPSAFRKTKVAWKPAGALQEGVTRTWLGAEYWANRLQDW